LDIRHLAGHHHFLAVVLLGMGEDLGDFLKAGCEKKPGNSDEGDKGE